MRMNFERGLQETLRRKGVEEAQRELDHVIRIISESLKTYNDFNSFMFLLLKNTLVELERCHRILEKIRLRDTEEA